MLFEPFTSPSLSLKNRVVMAPLTRNRAVDANTPNDLAAEYYTQRAGAGLIIAEGTSPSPNGLGYPRMPGLFNAAHVAGWHKVTDGVHAQGARIFVQLMHAGRVSHVANLPAGAEVVGPVALALEGEIYTDAHGMQPHSTPRAMTEADLAHAVSEYVNAARLALEAGFDGIELHAANGYLLDQFLNANVNTRTDAYGGSAGNRNRFVLEVARATAAEIGAARVGIRLSPYGVFNNTGAFNGLEEQYLTLARELGALKLAYLHLVDHSAMGAPEVPAAFKTGLRAAFGGTFIASGGFFDRESAEKALRDGHGDLVAFGRAWLANPDLIERMKAGIKLNDPDPSTFYTPGAKGYTDYPRADAGDAA
ncbi:alkene reductase [Paraburkholderia sp. UCT2]|uniref:alkene reductase n=1 Tax=Paraburkholderia sp. UCT2 TaxID=2615208 RepID=UPI001654EA6F|nr:alkene reductase [Paraburkholderia sp. UCT2]MBC8732292.1 alkene reductase [Paraburkholderia sp. UCT2]